MVQPSKTWCNTAHAHCREFAALQVGAMSPVPVQMWDGTHRSTRRQGLERLAGFAGERTVCSPPIAPPVKRRMQQHDAMNSMMLCNMQHAMQHATSACCPQTKKDKGVADPKHMPVRVHANLHHCMRLYGALC